MADLLKPRASAFRGTQIAVEPKPGTAGTAFRKLPSLEIIPSPRPNVGAFVPRGALLPTVARPGMESTEASLRAPGSYNEWVYPLTGVLGHPYAWTQPDAVGHVTVYRQEWRLNAIGEPIFRSFTVEDGSTARASEFNYGMVTEYGESYSNAAAPEGTGAMVGRAMSEGVVMSPTPSSVELVPIQQGETNVYLSDSYVFGEAQKVPSFISVSWAIRGRYAPVPFMDRALPSFSTHTVTRPTTEIRLRLSADALGMGLLATMRAGAKKYLRIYALGPIISGSYRYYAIRDFMFFITGGGALQDENGTILAVEWTGEIALNTSDGFAMRAWQQNRHAAL